MNGGSLAVGPDHGASGRFEGRHLALAIAVLAAILAASMLAGALAAAAFDKATGAGSPGPYAPGEIEALATSRLAVALLTFQVVNFAGALAAIAAFQKIRNVPLAPLTAPRGGVRGIALNAVVLIVLAAAYAAIIYLIDSRAIARDVKPFAAMIRSDGWELLTLAAVIGAPLAEELTFRGFVYGVLAASPAGPTVAIVVSSVMWASLHASYSGYGLVAIFLIGLYLGWLRKSSGSLWPPIICHSLYNAALALALAVAPVDALDFGPA